MDGLYDISPCGEREGAHVFALELDPAHPIFGGHFPDNPVLPGICSMMIVRECAARALGMPLRYSYIKDSKFMSMIVPKGLPLTVMLKIMPATDGIYAIDAAIYEGETVMLKLKAGLTIDE